jgi:hypothetical protein
MPSPKGPTNTKKAYPIGQWSVSGAGATVPPWKVVAMWLAPPLSPYCTAALSPLLVVSVA